MMLETVMAYQNESFGIARNIVRVQVLRDQDRSIRQSGMIIFFSAHLHVHIVIKEIISQETGMIRAVTEFCWKNHEL